MTFTETIPEDSAPEPVARMYAEDRAAFGLLPNLTRVFSLRPGVYEAWKALGAAVKADMDLRRYELATLAAARRLRSSYCALAHGEILADRFLGAEAVVAAPEGLDATDRAVMALADKIAADATTVTADDIDALRSLGLSDAEILDVILTAALRSFFSKVLDGTGTEPDARFGALDPALRDALTVGRPIASA